MNDINFHDQFEEEFHKLMNICNWHKQNLGCHKNNKDFKIQLCTYKFSQTLIKETHFEDDFKLLHIKDIMSSWIMLIHGSWMFVVVIMS
jgi:hypothetical protein